MGLAPDSISEGTLDRRDLCTQLLPGRQGKRCGPDSGYVLPQDICSIDVLFMDLRSGSNE